MKKVVIISSSPRKNGNSEILAFEAAKGAKEAGNEVEVLLLHDKTINFCRGCLACQKLLKCVIKDDMAEMIEKVKSADVLIFATPIYYYEMSGQLKTFLDRCNPIYPQEYAFRDVYLLASCADTDPSAIDGTVSDVKGWVRCFEKSSYRGSILAAGTEKPGDVRKTPAVLDEARNLGRNL